MTSYTVQPGDSLSKIALIRYGTYNPIGSWNPVQAIAQANNISNVNLISVGQVLNIPDKPGTVVSSTPAAVQSSSTATPVATTQAQTQPKPVTNTGSGSNTLKYVLISFIVGAAAFIGYKEFKKRNGNKKNLGGVEPEEFKSEKEAQEYLKKVGKKSGKFYWNVVGWDRYLTLEPTSHTPTGKAKGFPKSKIVKSA